MALGCGAVFVLLATLIFLGVSLLSKVPRIFPSVSHPIAPLAKGRAFGGGLAHFNSPYLGHTGSWDGKGGAMFGRSKRPDLDIERDMGLHWTFMPVYWRGLEPDGPVNLAFGIPAPWQELDRFVIAAKERGLNVLMQAPVVGGNAGGPPKWAGQLKAGRSAPGNIAAAAAFAGKLAARYCPGGTLAREQKWEDHFGIRAWELDNEPESYLVSWKDQAHEYAEFVSKAAAAIKNADPQAVILCPGMAGGGNGLHWLEQALTPSTDSTNRFSIGPVTDVVSFHCYEGLETALLRQDRTIEQDFMDVRQTFEKWEHLAPGFDYNPKQDFWHTEGNFDFLGVLSKRRRAAWRFQFFTRAFAAGIRKVCVMDASPPERVAIRAYVEALPEPFPMLPANEQVRVLRGNAIAFLHLDSPEPDAGRVWVVWAAADSGTAVVEIPARRARLALIGVDGQRQMLEASGGKIRLYLEGDRKMAPGSLLLDRNF